MDFLSQSKAVLFRLLKPAETPDHKRITLFLGTLGTSYALLLVALFQIWYSQNHNVAFHWFDDSQEWLFLDKFGHAYIAFTECRLLVNLFNWCGLKGSKNLVLSALIAFCMQSSYEVFDGLAADYGASIYDLMANAVGAMMVVVQYHFFKKIWVNYQFNFSLTDYAQLRPNMLGNSFWSRYFKDYNGQTYWFSINLRQLTKLKIFPTWFMLSIGYGGDGLLGGHDNIWEDKQHNLHDMSHIVRSRRFYLSFDVDFTQAKTSISWLNHLLYVSSYLKIPLPGLELHTEKGLRWRWFCY